MDKENQINNDMENETKNEFTLPKGCMVTKREIVPFSASQDDAIHSKKKTEKNKFDRVLIGIIAMGIISCVVLGLMYVMPKIKNEVSDKTTNTEVINTDTDAKTTESDDIAPIYNIKPEVENAASNTDANNDITTSEEATEENQYNNMIMKENDGIVIGGLIVNYGFDDTWGAVIEDGKYKAKKQVNSNYVSFTVEDSDVMTDNKTECLEFLSNLKNPFVTDGNLKENQNNVEITINGKDCYYTFYTGTTTEGNTYTIIGLMQNFGGDTYAYIVIEDTIGYSIENLIQSLSINLEEN